MSTIIKNLRGKSILSVFMLVPLLSYGQAAIPQSATAAQLKQMPPIPSSAALLQSALNDFNTCIANTLAASPTANNQAAADAVTSKCSAQQAKLKQILPPDAYNHGVADTNQYIARVKAAQSAANTPSTP